LTIFNKYLMTLVLAASMVNIFLAFFKQNSLEIYFVVNILSYLIITLLYVYINPRARAALNAISAILFGGFMVIVIIKVLEIIY